jgi:hypothetical protein
MARKRLQNIRAYSKERQLFTSGNWYTKGRKARFRRTFKKGARQQLKQDTQDRLGDAE